MAASLWEAPAWPNEASAFMALEAQVQQLSANQSSSQQQMQLMYVAQQTVQQQMQSLLAHLQTAQPQPVLSLPSLILPSLRLHSPHCHKASPTQLPPWQCSPHRPCLLDLRPSGAGMAPPLVANTTGRSLTSYFQDMRPALLLEIAKHEFDPGQLFKINPQMKDQPKDSHLQL